MSDRLRNNPVPDPDLGHLETSAQTATGMLRESLADALSDCGAPVDRPQNLSRHLSLDKSLGWKVSKLLTEPDPIVATRYLPGRPGQRLLVESLRQAGVAKARVDRVQESLELLEQVIEHHAGDRESFDLMVASMRSAALPEQEEQFRRMAFTGNSAIWGVQARAQLSCHLISPSATPDMLDFAIVSGLYDLRRLRSDTPWAIASIRSINDDGDARVDGTPIAIESDASIHPDNDSGHVPLMREFCSASLPPIAVRTDKQGITKFELQPSPIGNTGACSCITGWMHRAMVSKFRTAEDHFGEHFVSWSTPVEVAYHELYVHRSLAFAQKPSIHIYSQLPGGPRFPGDGRERGLLPIAGALTNLGAGPPIMSDGTIPRHREIIERTVARMGWSLTDFMGVRFALKFPPVPSLAVFRYDLAERT